MKLPQALIFLFTLLTTIHALALPTSLDALSHSTKDLFKRKGGGGGGGKGGGSTGGSGSTSSGGSTGGSSGGSTGGSSGGSTGGSSGGRTSGTSNTGGQTSRGSGTTPSFGGGSGPRYYAGGASVPYSAGTRRTGAAAPFLIGGAGLAAFPFVYGAYGLYAYPYAHPWYYHNTTSNQNETHPVDCICAQYGTCGCDPDNNSTDYINSVANNASVAQLARINGTDTLVINGTLPNGTTAAGGSDSAASSSLTNGALQAAGYWPIVAGVAYTVWFM